jgi:hypothetical protein
MGYEGNAPQLRSGAASQPARVIALAGADAGLDQAWSAAVGWSSDRSPAAWKRAADAGHPLIALDALRIALTAGDLAAAVGLADPLAAGAEPVRAAVRTAIGQRLAPTATGRDADRLRDLAR